MTTPFPPLSKTATTQAEQLVARAAAVPPRPIDAASWDELVARAAMRPAADARLIPAFLAAVALGAAMVLFVVRPAAPAPAVPAAQLMASTGAKWTQPSSSTVVLSEGRLSMVRADDTLVRIETPHAVIEARRCRFLAEVVSSGTLLVVDEGELVLRAGATTRVIHAGESLLWPPAPQIPARLLEAPAQTEVRCANALERRGCLESEAATSSLDAQAALYELGMLEAKSGRSDRAIETLQQSLRRFPAGVLHPEVRLALLVELVHARRFAEAQTVAAEFEVACADDPRRAEVGTLKAMLTP